MDSIAYRNANPASQGGRIRLRTWIRIRIGILCAAHAWRVLSKSAACFPCARVLGICARARPQKRELDTGQKPRSRSPCELFRETWSACPG